MFDILAAQDAIAEEDCDGWFFANFEHNDSLTDEILRLPSDSTASRRWFYIVPRQGVPVKIVHTVERGALDALEGETRVYTGADDLPSILRESCAGLKLAALADPALPVLSRLDAGTFLLAQKAGITIVSAAPLIQRIKSLLSPRMRASHERAAERLYSIVAQAWNFLTSRIASVTEESVQKFMLELLNDYGLQTDHPPIVAFGSRSADPHYDCSRGRSCALKDGDVVQFDIWAKEPRGIYADISWVGINAARAPDNVAQAFNAVCGARDEAVRYIAERLARAEERRAETDCADKKFFDKARGADSKRPSGAETDAFVREMLKRRGYASALRHRTGHGIDTACHGVGVNLDSIEFPDNRLLLDGALFSVEPGLYFEDFGVRTEINVFIDKNTPVVTGGIPQRELLVVRGQN